MKAQTIINICLAISVTLLIYQNNQQKDQIETANWFAQHSVDQTWDRMDRIEEEISKHIVKANHFVVPPPPDTETLESCLVKIPTGSTEGIEECWDKHKD